MLSVKKLTDNSVYTRVKSLDEAKTLAAEAEEMAQKGETVVIFFKNRYRLYLAPGQDPYQITYEVEKLMNQTSKTPVTETDSDIPNTPKTNTTTTTKTKKAFFKK